MTTAICRDGQSTITANIPFGGFKITGAANGSGAQDYATIANLAAPPAVITLGVAGTAAAPGYSWSADPNTGIYNIGADQIGITTGGTLRRTISTTAETTTLPQQGADGSAAAPAFAFSGATGTGTYRSGTQLGVATAGVARLFVDSTGIVPNTDFALALGSTTKRFTTVYAVDFSDGAAATGAMLSQSGTTLFIAAGTSWATVQIRTGGATRITVDASGNLTATGNVSGVQGIFSGAISEQGTSLVSKYLPATKVFVSSQQTITIPGTITVAHGLGAVPSSCESYIVNQITELGYAVGDIAKTQQQVAITQIWADATNVYLRFQAANMTTTTGGSSSITAANWKAVLVARRDF